MIEFKRGDKVVPRLGPAPRPVGEVVCEPEHDAWGTYVTVRWADGYTESVETNMLRRAILSWEKQ